MSLWRRYGFDDVMYVYNRPWWRLVDTNPVEANVAQHAWRRTDNHTLISFFEQSEFSDYDYRDDPAFLRQIDEYDRANPLAAPPAAVGQVWAYSSAATVMIVEMLDGRPVFSDGTEFDEGDWPPELALVFGPNAPWAPPDWDRDGTD